MPTAEGDLFPPSTRVIYGKAPLTQVICQLRFPPLLRIEGQPPADFQERIRSIFPLLSRTHPQLPELPSELFQMLGVPQGQYSFRTEDGTSTLNLGSDAIAMNTTAYKRWENFVSCLEPALQALIDIYQPSFFQRVGLRYINTIQRSKIGIEHRNWSELFRPEILGELALERFENNATEARRNIRVALPNESGCGLLLQHGFAKKNDSPEILYQLDFDFYTTEKTEVAHAKPTLDKLNSMVGRAFRWCITELLHESLEPTPIELAASNS